MPLPVTPLRHRLQVLGALSLSIGSVAILARVVNAHGGGHCHSRSHHVPAVTTTYIPVIPVVPATPPQPFSELLKSAAASGDVDRVKELAARGSLVHEGESDNDAPLLLADARPDVINVLLGAGVNEPDLSTACIAGAPNAVARILAKGESPNPTNGTTPLYDALESPTTRPEVRLRIVDNLLEAGANPNGEPAPLMGAMISCTNDGIEPCMKVIRLLHAKGAKIDGITLAASFTADPAILDYLLTQPLEPGVTSSALANGSAVDPATVKKVAAKGVIWNWRDGEVDSASPLVDAVDLVDYEMVRAMLESGAPADLQLKDGRCALGQAIDAYPNSNIEAPRIVELLLARGASPNRRFPDGRSPLFAAAETGDIRIVNALLKAGARVNDKVLDETPLDVAIRSEHIAVARVLDGHGGRPAVKPTEE